MKVRYWYIHSDKLIELFHSQDVITSDFTALVLFDEPGRVYIIRDRFKRYIKFGIDPNKRSNAYFCHLCGKLYESKFLHLEYCTVKGRKLSIGSKVGEDSEELSSLIKNVFESLGVVEDTESAEPEVYLRRSCSLNSTAVIRMRDKDQTLRCIFNVYYYCNLQFKCTNTKYVTSLHNCSNSKLCNASYLRFLSIYKTVTIANLESYFKNVQCKFYFKCKASNKLNACKFELNNQTYTKKIFLVYIIGQFMVAPRGHLKKWVKIQGLSASWCPLCAKYFKNTYKHTLECSINRFCNKCLNACQTSALSDYISKCSTCQIVFRSRSCFDFHKSGGICNRIYICQYCGEYVNRFIYRSKHECSSTQCGICNEKINKDDYRHQCRIQKIKDGGKLKQALIVSYDVECFRDKENYECFKSCLIVAHTACNDCTLINRDNAENGEKCEFCLSLKVEFLGTGCVAEFVNFLLKLELEYCDRVNTIYVIGINAGRFDSWFIYNYILSNTELLHSPPLVRANRILLLPFSTKLKCIDALCFIPMGWQNTAPVSSYQ